LTYCSEYLPTSGMLKSDFTCHLWKHLALSVGQHLDVSFHVKQPTR